MNAWEIVLIAAGIVYVLGTRLFGQLLEAKKLVLLPVVLTVLGLAQLRHIERVTAAGVVFIGIGFAISIALGVVRGRTVHLGQRDGVMWMRYRVSSVLLWVANLAAKAALIPVERIVSTPSADAADKAILASIGLGILAETAVVLVRALRHEADIVWEKGENGGPHKTLPVFDRARHYLRGTDGADGASSFAMAWKRLGETRGNW